MLQQEIRFKINDIEYKQLLQIKQYCLENDIPFNYERINNEWYIQICPNF